MVISPREGHFRKQLDGQELRGKLSSRLADIVSAFVLTRASIETSLVKETELLGHLQELDQDEFDNLMSGVWVAISDKSEYVNAKTPSESVLFAKIKDEVERVRKGE